MIGGFIPLGIASRVSTRPRKARPSRPISPAITHARARTPSLSHKTCLWIPMKALSANGGCARCWALRASRKKEGAVQRSRWSFGRCVLGRMPHRMPVVRGGECSREREERAGGPDGVTRGRGGVTDETDTPATCVSMEDVLLLPSVDETARSRAADPGGVQTLLPSCYSTGEASVPALPMPVWRATAMCDVSEYYLPPSPPLSFP